MPSPCLNGEVEGNCHVPACYMITSKRAMLAGINGKGEVVSKPLSDSLLPCANQSMGARALLFQCTEVTYLLQDCGVVKERPYFLSTTIGIAYSTHLSAILSLQFWCSFALFCINKTDHKCGKINNGAQTVNIFNTLLWRNQGMGRKII